MRLLISYFHYRIEVEYSSKMTVENEIVNDNDADMKELPNKLMASGDEGDVESD